MTDNIDDLENFCLSVRREPNSEYRRITPKLVAIGKARADDFRMRRLMFGELKKAKRSRKPVTLSGSVKV